MYVSITHIFHLNIKMRKQSLKKQIQHNSFKICLYKDVSSQYPGDRDGTVPLFYKRKIHNAIYIFTP